MSTVDPRLARQEQERSGSGPRAFLTLALAAVHLGLWGLAGYGFGQLYDTFRVMSLNQVGSWDSRFGGGPSLLFFVGVFAGSFLGFVVTRLAARFLGLLAASILPLITGAAGIAIGLALFIPEWTPEQSYGEKLPLISGEPQPWGTGEWIHFWLPLWLPVVFAILALLLLVLAVILALRRRSKQQRMTDLLERGRRVTGDVTEVRPTGISINDMPYLAFTVRFRDHLGTERWVTKKSTFPAGPPRLGEPAAVWFDPADPGNEKHIMVGLGPEAANPAPDAAG